MKARNYSRLTAAQRRRFFNYVKLHQGLSSKQLAEDLVLNTTTVAAIKANVTRQQDAQVAAATR